MVMASRPSPRHNNSLVPTHEDREGVRRLGTGGTEETEAAYCVDKWAVAGGFGQEAMPSYRPARIEKWVAGQLYDNGMSS
jgi:hypothetical protein